MKLVAVSDSSKTKDLACAYLQLAWKACGTETGMGFLQAVPSLGLYDVLRHCPPRNVGATGWSQMDADYLAGRMVKTYINFSEDGFVKIEDNTPRSDYQGWATVFKSHWDLLEAAADAVGVTVTPAQ